MSYDDPFSTAPVDPEPEQETVPNEHAGSVTVAVKPSIVSATDAGLSVTFKGDGTYTAPWLVPKYSNVSEALVDFGVDPQEVAAMSPGNRWAALMTKAQQMASFFAGLGGGRTSVPTNNGGGQQNTSNAPQGAQQAPGGEKKFCSHGEMTFKSGVSKAGNAYSLFSCNGPRAEQCKAQYPSK